MKILFTILMFILMIFVWLFCLITILMGTAYVIKVGFTEVFNIELLENIKAKEYFEKLFSKVKES